VDIGAAEARLYFRYLELSRSSSRQDRLTANDPSGPLWRNYDRISSLVRAGARDAADAAALLASCATEPEQIAYIVAGPFEDLWYADAQAFYDHVLPRLPGTIIKAAIGGMWIPAEGIRKIKAYLDSRA